MQETRGSRPPEVRHIKGAVRILAAACDEFLADPCRGASTRDLAAAGATTADAHGRSKDTMLFKLWLLSGGSTLGALWQGFDIVHRRPS